MINDQAVRLVPRLGRQRGAAAWTRPAARRPTCARVGAHRNHLDAVDVAQGHRLRPSATRSPAPSPRSATSTRRCPPSSRSARSRATRPGTARPAATPTATARRSAAAPSNEPGVDQRQRRAGPVRLVPRRAAAVAAPGRHRLRQVPRHDDRGRRARDHRSGAPHRRQPRRQHRTSRATRATARRRSNAPPKDTQDNTATNTRGVGAHQSHLATDQPVQARRVHRLPPRARRRSTSVGHIDTPLPAELTFSARAGVDHGVERLALLEQLLPRRDADQRRRRRRRHRDRADLDDRRRQRRRSAPRATATRRRCRTRRTATAAPATTT